MAATFDLLSKTIVTFRQQRVTRYHASIQSESAGRKAAIIIEWGEDEDCATQDQSPKEKRMTSGRVAPEPDVVDAKCRDILERFGYDRGPGHYQETR